VTRSARRITRFDIFGKADEAAQTITGPYRRAHPEDNNERQAIHEHVSVPLVQLKQPSIAGKSHLGTGALAVERVPSASAQSKGAMN
jgi:hypothetical protein